MSGDEYELAGDEEEHSQEEDQPGAGHTPHREADGDGEAAPQDQAPAPRDEDPNASPNTEALQEEERGVNSLLQDIDTMARARCAVASYARTSLTWRLVARQLDEAERELTFNLNSVLQRFRENIVPIKQEAARMAQQHITHSTELHAQTRQMVSKLQRLTMSLARIPAILGGDA